MATTNVKIKGAGWVKWLKVEQIDHVLNRQALITPLPGEAGTGKPQAFSIDMGMMNQDIVLRGVIRDSDPDESAGTATWRDLRHIVIRSWKDLVFGWNDLLAPTGSLRIGYYPYSGSAWLSGGTIWYRTLPTSFELTREGGHGYWVFSLTLAVVAWPPVNYEI